MANAEIKQIARKHKIPQWRIALALGISEATLTRWLRVELPPDKKVHIEEIIEHLSVGGEYA